MFSEHFEGLFAPLGKKAGLSGHDMSLIYTPQIIASIVQIPVNLFTTELGSKFVDLVLGVIGGLAVGTGYVRGKAAAELSEMVSYWISNLWVPLPAQTSMPSQISLMASGIASGDLSKIQASLFTSPASAQAELDTYLNIFNPSTYQTTATPLIKPSVAGTVAIKPAPTSTQPVKTYVASVSPSSSKPLEKHLTAYS